MLSWKIKSDIDLNDFQKLTPELLKIFAEFLIYARENNLPVCITSIISDRENVNASSTTHETGRAIDLSVVGWSEFHIKRCCHKINNSCKDIAAISSSDMKPRAAIFHDVGSGYHIHLQARKVNG